MKKFILTIVILSFTLTNVLGQGLKLATKEQLDNVEVWINEDRGFTETLPKSFSMEEFCPPVMKQVGSSCVGWTIYASMSTMYNFLENRTNYMQKLALAFDPYFIYAAIKKSYDIDCKNGVYMYEALRFLIDNGNKRWGMEPYYTCNSDWSNEKWEYTQLVAKPFAPNDFYLIEGVEDVKSCVSKYQPVMLGVKYGRSMGPLGSEGGTVGSDGLWKPEKDEKSTGGHAVTVVGYDDYKFGGAFRIMNSWGSDYGDNGFMWIKYTDFERLIDEAWALYPKLYNSKDADKTIETSYYTRYTYDNGTIYEGTYFENKAHGQGYFIYPNGNIFFTSLYYNEYDGVGLYFDVEENKMIKYKHDKGTLVSEEELGFASGQLSELDMYLESFPIDGKRIIMSENDQEFEIPEILNLNNSNKKSVKPRNR